MSGEKNSGVVDEHVPLHSISFRALSRIEQSVTRLLLDANSALTPYDIYQVVVAVENVRKDQKKTSNLAKNFGVNKAQMEYVDVPGTITRGIEKIKKELRRQNKERKRANQSPTNFEKYAQDLNRKKNLGVPSYPTIKKLCEDFAKIGWFATRRHGKTSVYFLEKTTAEKLRKELSAPE